MREAIDNRELPAIAALPILFRDEHLIAVHKPSGLLVHRTSLDWRERRFALQMLRDQIGRRVFPVHRLDKGTSGVLLFAQDADVARHVGQQFATQQVGKTYLAIVRGVPPANGVIDHPLARLPEDLAGDDDTAAPLRDACTHFRRLATIELPHRVDRYPTSRYALLELRPEGGRRHQLRRHLKHVSHPIVGDTTYGKSAHNRLFQQLFRSRRLLLACVEMRLRHPITAFELTVQAPLDGEFHAVVQALGWAPFLPAAARGEACDVGAL